MEAEDVKVVLLSEVSKTSSSSSSSSIASVVVAVWVISVKVSLIVVCGSFAKNASTLLPFCKCSFKIHFSVSLGANLEKVTAKKMTQRSKAINLFIRCCLEEPGQEAPDSSDTVSITWFRWELVKIDRPPHRLDSLGEEVVAGKGAFELSPLWVALPAHQQCQHHCQLKWTSWSRTTYGSTASLPPGMGQCPWRAPPAGTSGSPSRCCTRTLLENALSRCHHWGKPHYHLCSSLSSMSLLLSALYLTMHHYRSTAQPF